MPTITAKHSRIYITYISRYLSVAFQNSLILQAAPNQ